MATKFSVASAAALMTMARIIRFPPVRGIGLLNSTAIELRRQQLYSSDLTAITDRPA